MRWSFRGVWRSYSNVLYIATSPGNIYSKAIVDRAKLRNILDLIHFLYTTLVFKHRWRILGAEILAFPDAPSELQNVKIYNMEIPDAIAAS